MSIIYLLITISLVVALFFFFTFIKAVKSGQFEDSYTPSVRMLFDDSPKTTQLKNKTNSKNNS